jgi:hypothetical protein
VARLDPIDWARSQIDRHGLWKALSAPLVALATVGGVAQFFSSSIEAGLVATVVVLGATALVLLAITRLRLDRLEREHQEMQRAATTLRAYVVEHLPTKPTTLLWHDFQEVGKRGDTFSRVELKLRVEAAHRALHFLQVEQIGEPLSPGEQRRMEITARREPDGARLPVDWEWRSAGTLRFWIHFEKPIPPGQEVDLSYQYAWPHTLPKLSQRGIEHTEWTCDRPTKRFEFVVRLDAWHKRDRPLKITVHGVDPAAVRQAQDGAGWKVEGLAENLEEGHQIALTLDAG